MKALATISVTLVIIVNCYACICSVYELRLYVIYRMTVCIHDTSQSNQVIQLTITSSYNDWISTEKTAFGTWLHKPYFALKN